MKQVMVILLALSATAAPAQDTGESLMERGARQFLEGLMQEMEPALDGLNDLGRELGPTMRQFIEQMGPALDGLMSKVDDWSVYHPPEILPNGDIIIRRKEHKSPDVQKPGPGEVDI